MTKQDVMHLQTLLCLPEDGVFGSETRVGISIYQDTRRLPLTGEIGQTESRKWVQDFAQMGACTLAAQNFYERLNFATADKVDGLKTRLLQIVPDPPLSLNGKFDQPTRDKITAVRNALMPPNEKIDPVPNGQMTRVLNVAIDNQLRH